MSYVYIFNHIPKCGGTTVRFAFKEWFDVEMDYRQGWSDGGYDEFVNHPLDLNQLQPNQLVAGHYCIHGSYLSQRYGSVYQDQRYRLITFVRDPLAQIISLYNFREREGQNSNSDSLFNYLFHQRNFISRILECHEDNYQEVIDKYFFVGTQEKLQASFDLLAKKLGKPPISLKKYTKNVAPKREKPAELDDELREKFRENNSLDYKIVSYCNELLERV